ncbi:hypothetical protein HDU76_002285, partial [Blyttiomyces sp. JEL0837]
KEAVDNLPMEGSMTLFDDMARTMFNLTTKSVHSLEVKPEELYESYKTFGEDLFMSVIHLGKQSTKPFNLYNKKQYRNKDTYFSLLSAGFPISLLPKVQKSMTYINTAFGNLLDSKSDPESTRLSPVEVLRRKRFLGIGGRDTYVDMARAFLWAQHNNTLAAACWTLGFILSDEEIYQRVRKEVDDAVANGPPEIASLPYLDACVNESLRCVMTTLSLRECHVDKELTFDPEIFPDPDKFDPTRFLEGSPSAALALQNLYAFGGGASKCPARQFVRSEMRVFVASMIQHYDLKLDGPLPELNHSQGRFGGLQPKNDVNVKFKRRT